MRLLMPRPNSSTQRFSFPKNFIWGVAAAAPQIEGAAFSDGKGESTWDHYSRIPGKVRDGDTLDVACDHYHRFRQDFKLMKKLGIKHYRLSLAWPRLYPRGDGELNPKGVDFYKRLFDAMGENGITPWVTLFHWDLPQALEERGGWRNRGTVDAFAGYADTAVKHFGSRVKHWFTLNEIIAFTQNAYGSGRNAPGLKESAATVNQTYHHALLCHGHGVRAVREYGSRGSIVGLVDNPKVPMPLTEAEKDIRAARQLFVRDSIRVLDPLYKGEYSAEYRREIGDAMPKVEKGDFDLITLPTDFLGLNVYWGYFARCGKSGKAEALPFPVEYPSASSPWLKITPQSLYWAPRHMRDIYGEKSIYITEHGCGYVDEPVVNGECLDLHRRDLVRNYLKELHRAIQEGVQVKGYFLWSFMDNFEWSHGYSIRFGICHMDYKTLKRTPKLSAKWYSAVMQANGFI